MTEGQGAAGGLLAGRYELREQLGRGGMATVRRAYQPALDRFVAIKLIDPLLASDPAFVARFRLEARIAARLRHPNILTIYDFGDDVGTLYLVTELIDGGTLEARLDTIDTFATALDLVEQIGRSLDYAHGQGIIHRDVKPSNVFLEGGRAILADFGIAKQVTDVATDGLTMRGVGIGTPEYMAPEQVLGRPIDGRADIYALATILYRLVAGRLPFIRYGADDTALALLMRKINEPIPAPSTYNAAISPTLDAILLRALAYDPEVRYPTAAAFVAAVRGALGLRKVSTRSHHDTAPFPLFAPTPDTTAQQTVPVTLPTGSTDSPSPPGATAPPNQHPSVSPAREQHSAARRVLVGGAALLFLLFAISAGALALGRMRGGEIGATTTTAPLLAEARTPVSATSTALPATTAATASPVAFTTPATATPSTTPSPLPPRTPAVAPGTAATVAPLPTSTQPTTPLPTPSPRPTAMVATTPSTTATVTGISQNAHAAILSLPGTSSGVFIDLKNGSNNASDDPDRVFPAASLIKLSIAGAAYQRVANGQWRIDHPFTLTDTVKVGGTGILRNQPVGTTYPLDQLIAIMLINSDNTAANMIVAGLGGFDAVNAFNAAQGMTNTIMRRKLYDPAAQAQGLENTTTAGDLARFFSLLHGGQIVDRDSSDRLRTILAERGREDKNWALQNLPADTIALHMTGTATGQRGDAILVTSGEQQYILILLVSAPDEPRMEAALARVSATIYGLVTGR